MKGPYWVKQWITNLAMLNEQFRNEDGSVDFEALGREEYAFRTAIITRKFEKSPRAKEVFDEAMDTYRTNSERGKRGGLAKAAKNNGDAPTREGSDASTTVSRNIGNDQGTDAMEKVRTVVNSGRVVKSATAAPRHKAPAATVRMPSWPEFLQYVNANNIDYTDAREWFEMSIVDRDGKDREGNAIKNWKAALKAFCRAKAEGRRKTA